MQSMKTLRYDGDNEEYPVSSFKIIEEQKNVVSVFIEIDDTATKAKNEFLKLINKKISRQKFEIYKNDFHLFSLFFLEEYNLFFCHHLIP